MKPPEPDAFDPLRFSPEGAKGRHKYAYVPFGGGAHMCLGLHFAVMQIKILMWHILRPDRRSLLTPGEIALLITAAHFHDMGMGLSESARADPPVHSSITQSLNFATRLKTK